MKEDKEDLKSIGQRGFPATFKQFFNSPVPKLQLKFYDSKILDLVALQNTSGNVVVEDFITNDRAPIQMSAIVIESVVSDDESTDLKIKIDSNLIFSAKDAVRGKLFTAKDYVGDTPNIQYLIPADLTISGNAARFKAGKVAVGYWYWTVE